MGRTIYILGEDHLKADQTDLKLSILSVSKEYEIHDFMVFDELSVPSIRTTPRRTVSSIPIPPPIEALEKLFWILHHTARLKEELDADLLEQVSFLVEDACKKTVHPDEIEVNLPKIFKECKRRILEACAETHENTTKIQSYIQDLTLDELVVDSTFGSAFFQTYQLVDKAIVRNVVRENADASEDVTFIVIVGEDHVNSIERKLLTADPSFIVYTIHEDEKDMKLDMQKYKLAIGKSRKQKPTRRKRNPRKGDTRSGRKRTASR
jgi:hypothetical protein